MDSDKHRFLYKEETHQIIGCSFDVLNELGHGLLEKPYENALGVELKLRNISYRQQARYNVIYKNHIVGEYIPDLIVFDKIVVDTKVIDTIENHEMGQMLNYLKITSLKVGLIINFRHSKLEYKRVVL